MKNRVKSLNFTILTESSVALSNDQGFSNYTPIKKCFAKDGQHAITSVGTITYEMRKQLFQKGIKPSGIVLNAKKDGKVTNMYPFTDNVEALDESGIENDLFGFLIPDKQLSKTSPLRIIPFKSIHTYKNDTQLITNRGFLDLDSDRKYYNNKQEEYIKEELPKTQALANEEVFQDYYVYTLTIELDRLGVLEVKDGKYLTPDKREYWDKKIRMEVVKKVVEVTSEFTRTIKHQTVHLKPLAVFGGAFESVVPYFWNDVELNKDNTLNLNNVIETIKSYELNKNNYIVGVSSRLAGKLDNEQIEINEYPVKAMKQLIDRLEIGEDNYWYLEVR